MDQRQRVVGDATHIGHRQVHAVHDVAQRPDVFPGMLVDVGKRHGDDGQAFARLGHADGPMDSHPVRVRFVQPLDVTVEIIAQGLQAVCFARPLLLAHPSGGIPSTPELLQHVDLAGLVGVQFETECTQPHISKAPVDHIERGLLLGHEQNRFAQRHVMRDHIGDRLGLARARRADHDEVLALARCDHGRQL